MITFTGNSTAMELNEANLQVIIALLTSLFIASIAIPTIVTVASKKGLISMPNGRTSHKGDVPVLGGLALFLGVGISTAVWTVASDFPEFNGIFGASLILMAIGLKDDILIIDPVKKFVGEIIAAGVIIIFAGIRFTSFQGTLGVYELGYTFSIVFTLFVIILIINAFNLIDGIDGLASGIGILASFVYGYWFYRVGEIPLAVLSLSLTGALMGFFYFNVLGGRNKIFMGDTGALLLGMLLAVLSIKFIEMNITNTSTYQMNSAPAISIALIGIPLFDTLRVFVIRIFRKKSPFSADKNHIHHILLGLNFAHLESTLILLIMNSLLVLIAILFRSLHVILLVSILLLVFLLFCQIMLTIRKKGLLVRRQPVEIYETRFGMMMAGHKHPVPPVPDEPEDTEPGAREKGKQAEKQAKKKKKKKSKKKKKHLRELSRKA